MSLRKCTPLSACGCYAKLRLCLHLSYLGLSSRRSLRTFPTFHMAVYMLVSSSFVAYAAREEDFLFCMIDFNLKCKIILFRSEEHTSELQSRFDLVCRLLLEKKNNRITQNHNHKYT